MSFHASLVVGFITRKHSSSSTRTMTLRRELLLALVLSLTSFGKLFHITLIVLVLFYTYNVMVYIFISSQPHVLHSHSGLDELWEL